MVRTSSKREAKVETVAAPVMEAVEEPTVASEQHPATEGDLMKHQLRLKEFMDGLEQEAHEIESLTVEIADDKEREKAIRHLEAVAKGLLDSVAKVGVQDKKLGWVRAGLEKAAAKAKAALAKAAREKEKAEKASAKAAADKAGAKK